jgi:hypothetical protein
LLGGLRRFGRSRAPKVAQELLNVLKIDKLYGYYGATSHVALLVVLYDSNPVGLELALAVHELGE